MKIVLLCGVAAIGGLYFAAGRIDPLAARIDGESTAALPRWRARLAERFTLDEWREFDACVTEVRWGIQRDGGAGDETKTAQQLARVLNGCTFHEVLRLGCTAKIARLQGLRAHLKESADGNARLVPADASSGRELARVREKQHQRLRDFDAEIASAAQRLSALGGQPPPAPPATATALPAPLSRSEALAEIQRLMETRRSLAAFKHGAWPLRIDPDGTSLPPDEQENFRQRRAAAADAGEVLIPVRLKGKWWLYQGRPEVPAFPETVVGQLSPEEMKGVSQRWVTLQAELWARAEAATAPVERMEWAPPR